MFLPLLHHEDDYLVVDVFAALAAMRAKARPALAAMLAAWHEPETIVPNACLGPIAEVSAACAQADHLLGKARDALAAEKKEAEAAD